MVAKREFKEGIPMMQGMLNGSGANLRDVLGGMKSEVGHETTVLPEMPFIRHSREAIVEMVKQSERDKQSLFERMREDYGLYALDEYVVMDQKEGRPLTDYHSYTSNGPRTLADRVIAWLNEAKFPVRARHLEVEGHLEEADNLKERFAIGCLAQADERLAARLEPSVSDALSFYIAVRGGYVGGRALLRWDSRGRVIVDIQPFDPLQTHFEVGEDGLKWVCRKMRMTRRQIRAQYGVLVEGGTGGSAFQGSNDAELDGIDVYDFYDEVFNTVVTENAVLRPPTPHLAARVPVFMVLVGSQPLLYQDDRSDLVAGVGETVFSGVRGIADKINEVLSILLEQTAKVRRQTIIYRTDGKPLETDVRTEGTTITIPKDADLRYLELERSALETLPYLEFLVGEWQRGSGIPFSSYGALQFQLSGYAVNLLQRSMEAVLASRLEAKRGAIKQIVELLYDQFMTGMYDGMSLSGVDKNRKRFRQTLTNLQLQGTCDYIVETQSKMPQDDLMKWQIAEIAKRTGLLSDRDILDEMSFQDSQQLIDKVIAQKAQGATPETSLATLIKAALDRSASPDDEWAFLANLLAAEYSRLIAIKTGQMPDFAPGGGPSSSGAPQAGGGAPGARPEAMPNAMTGARPEPETSNSGPAQVAPGSPRPGAQGQEDQNRQF